VGGVPLLGGIAQGQEGGDGHVGGEAQKGLYLFRVKTQHGHAPKPMGFQEEKQVPQQDVALPRCPLGPFLGVHPRKGGLDGPLLRLPLLPLHPRVDDLVQVGEGVLEVRIEDEDHGGLLHLGLAEGRFPKRLLGGGVPHPQKAPGLQVPSGRRPEGSLENIPQELLGHGVRPIAADGAAP